MTRVRRVLVLVLVYVASALPLAQGGGGQPPAGAAGRGQRPARAQPQRVEAPRGTSVMRGQIVAADNGAAIRRAQVRINSPESREGRVATTDQQGRFEFKELPAGRYTMTASKAGFVPLQYGQRRIRIRNAHRAWRRPDDGEDFDRVAERQRARRPHHR